MTTYHVGGFNPIHYCKTLKDALDKAKADDIIEIHKNINEAVTITKPIQIKGNGHTWRVPQGKLGIKVTAKILISDVNFEVESRANALSIEKDSRLTNITIKLIGPLVEIYPSILINGGTKHVLKDCIITKLYTAENTEIEVLNCYFYSYYGNNIETTNRDETSLVKGYAYIKDSYISSSTFYDVDIHNSTIGKYVQIESADLSRLLFSTELPDKVQSYVITPKRLRKEPEHGPLSEQTENDYHIYATGDVAVEQYTVATPAQKTTGFYFNGANVKIIQTNNRSNDITNYAIRSNISFTKTNDKNFWSLDDTKIQLIQSDVNSNSSYETAMSQLNKLVGLKNVKNQLRSLLNSIQLGQAKGFSNHMIFAGEPGTGKTTVAKIVAQALFEVGAIPENKCTFATVDTLIKGYVGQTAEHVREVLDSALGGVLFIDEAYQLTVKKGANTFNDEALTVILRYMEDHRDNLVVIAAGYTAEMREFLASNVGFSRRFQWIEFDDYTPKEMAQIFELMRESNDDQYAPEVKPENIEKLFEKVVAFNLQHPDVNGRVTNGGNGGLVRNIYQNITQAKNDRYMMQGGDLTIQNIDITKGFEKEIRQSAAKFGIGPKTE